MPSSTMRVPMSGNRAQRLPEYNGPAQAPVVAQTSARLDDSAGAIATANWRNGSANPWKDVQRTFDNVARINDNVYTMYDRYSKYKAQEALNNYQEAMMVKKADLERLEGANAIGANGGKSIQQQLHEYGEELRGQLGEGLNERSRMFFDNFAASEDKKNYVWAVGKERREWDAYQKTVDLGTIQTAYNTAINDPGQVGNAMGIITATYEQMGRREGWSPEFTKAKVTQEEQRVLGDMITTRLDANDLAGAGQLMAVYGQKLSPVLRMKYTEARGTMVLQQAQAMADAGDFAGARRLIAQNAMFGGNTGGNAFAGMNGQGLGSLSARFESGNAGSNAVGYDKNGGTSYGRYQLSSKAGSLDGFMKRLAASGEEGKAIVERLNAAGPANTGSRKGAFPDQWRKEMAEHGQLMQRIEHETMEQENYLPALNRLPKGLRDMVANSGPMQEMVWSMAVQHGGGGASKILKRVYSEGMTPQEVAEAAYAIRGNYFGSSTAEVQEAVRSRFKSEKDMVLAALAGTEAPATDGANGEATAEVPQPAQGQRPVYSLGSPALDARTAKFMNALNKAERAANVTKVGQEIWKQTEGLNGEERTAQATNLLMSIEGLDPDTQSEILKTINEMDKLETAKWKARDYRDSNDFVQKGKDEGWDIFTFNKELENASMTPEAKEMARKQFGSKQATEITIENTNALRDLKTEIDNKRDMTDDEIAVYAANNKLTPGQYKEAVKYRDDGGNVGHLSQSDINTAYLQMFPDKEKKDVPEWMWAAVAKELQPGKPVTQEAIKPIIARMLIQGEADKSGRFWDSTSSMTYGESITNPKVKPGSFKVTDLTTKQRQAIVSTIKSSNEKDILREYLANPGKYPAEG